MDFNRGRVVATGEPGCVPEQPADAVDAAGRSVSGSSFGHLNADLLWNEAQSARISRRQLGYGSELP